MTRAMTYVFSPLRFSLIVFGLSVAAAVLAGVVQRFAGLTVGGGLLAAIPLIIATTLEARRFGRSLSAPPPVADCRTLALRCAVTGALTYLLIMGAGLVLLRGTAVFAQADVWLEPVMMVIVAALCTFFAGYFIIQAMARAAWKDRA